MPQCFLESFGKQVTVILDCFEIFIEKPKSFNSSAECWSNYKHHRTLKYLIGITPQGSISFISEGYGGRASDKFVTEDCGILDLLLPGSVVLADRGFLIENCVHQVGAKLKIPAFTKGKIFIIQMNNIFQRFLYKLDFYYKIKLYLQINKQTT